MTSLLGKVIPGQKVFGPELPDYDELQNCLRCGRCLTVCPTYQETLLETDSPRGRLSLLRAVEDGKLPLSEGVLDHLYNCLDCRACNTVCPLSLPIGELILKGRAAYSARYGRPLWQRISVDTFLNSARSLEWVMAPARIYRKLRLHKIVRPILRFLGEKIPAFRTLYEMETLLPEDLPSKPLHKAIPETLPAYGERKYRVGFFLGCMMSQVLADVSQSSIELLRRLGCEVVVPKDQVCCGAPHEDQGNKPKARELARTNIRVFEKFEGLDVIVSDCAACSGMLKEYRELLSEDEEFARRAEAFSAKVLDVSQFLAQLLPGAPSSPPNDSCARCTLATYHSPCHLGNAQGVLEEPKSVVRSLPQVKLVPLKDETKCCGSAGIYNITHIETSRALLREKVDNIVATGAGIVVTGNPGCMLQIQKGLRERGVDIEVKHLTQITLEKLKLDREEQKDGSDP